MESWRVPRLSNRIAMRLLSIRSLVKVVYLKGSKEVIAERLRHRSGHFMNPDLLQSQFDTLEEPRDAIVVDVSMAPEAIVSAIRTRLGR